MNKLLKILFIMLSNSNQPWNTIKNFQDSPKLEVKELEEQEHIPEEIVIDFNDKSSPFYNESLLGAWSLIIEQKYKKIKDQKKLRKEFILSYKKYDSKNKPTKIRGYGINSNHKGCMIGKLMNDFLGKYKKIELKNLINFQSYNVEQPDFLLIAIYMFILRKDDKYITKNYLKDYWFNMCYGIFIEEKNGYELEFPWWLIDASFPFDERIINDKFYLNAIKFIKL